MKDSYNDLIIEKRKILEELAFLENRMNSEEEINRLYRKLELVNIKINILFIREKEDKNILRR